MPIPLTRTASTGTYSATAAAVAATGVSIAIPCRAIYNGVAQNMTITMADGGAVAFVDVPIGILPVQATSITFGTAGSVIWLW